MPRGIASTGGEAGEEETLRAVCTEPSLPPRHRPWGVPQGEQLARHNVENVVSH